MWEVIPINLTTPHIEEDILIIDNVGSLDSPGIDTFLTAFLEGVLFQHLVRDDNGDRRPNQETACECCDSEASVQQGLPFLRKYK